LKNELHDTVKLYIIHFILIDFNYLSSLLKIDFFTFFLYFLRKTVYTIYFGFIESLSTEREKIRWEAELTNNSNLFSDFFYQSVLKKYNISKYSYVVPVLVIQIYEI